MILLSVDANYEGLEGVNTGIDVLTDQGAYNVVRSYTTIVTSKLDMDTKIDHIAKTIVQTRKDGNPFKFVIGLPESDVPPSLAERLTRNFGGWECDFSLSSLYIC